MFETNYDTRLFAELYDVKPQAIVWMRPVFSADGKQLLDFEFNYSNNHNGFIWAEGEPGKGATFKILFPLQ